MRPKDQPERILVFQTELLHRLGYFQGLTFTPRRYLDVILRQGNALYLPRDVAEHDESYKQLIPYVILRYESDVFGYRRGRMIGEERLLGLRSIGIGGHIKSDDTSLFEWTYERGMERELMEEVEFETNARPKEVALLNDDSNEVGRVHFGVIHVLTLNKKSVVPKERGIAEPSFYGASQLRALRDQHESWSQICIDNIEKLLELSDLHVEGDE